MIVTAFRFPSFELFSRGMTFGTVLDIENVYCRVHARHRVLIVLVAIVAGVYGIGGLMAHFARGLFAAMIERERMSNQLRGTPARRSVASGARGAELPTMHRRFGMALDTISWRAAKTIVDMAFGACDLGMLAIEREDGGVIESFQTIGPIVAREARLAHRGAVLRDKLSVLALVAINTVSQHSSRIDLTGLRDETVTRTTDHRRFAVIDLMMRE